MADRYWVGGSGTWDATSTAHWSATSGGASGASVPTTNDNVFFDTVLAASVTLTGSLNCLDLNVTRGTNFSSTGTLTITRNFNGSLANWSATGTITFISSTSATFLPAPSSMPCSIIVNKPTGTLTLTGNLNLSSSTRTLTLTAGTFNAAGYTVTTGLVSITGSTTRTLTMGSGLWTLSGTGTVWNAATTTGLTFNVNTANILLSDTSTTARTFAGGDLTYNKLTIGGTTGISTLTINGANTFSELASTKTVAHTITFPSSTTTTVGAWSISGTAGNLVILTPSTAATAYTLTKSGGGVVSADYLSISYSTATPSSTWYAGANSVNTIGNSGWIFTAPPVGGYVANSIFFGGTF
jgi:hypothetical protein